MKDLRLLVILLMGILILQCKPGRKVTYDIPADFPKDRRNDLIAQFEKGKIIYKTNCAECHGIFTKGKDSTPNFTQVQFDNYSARFLRGDIKNHGIARRMSAEQLNQVLTFLRYKKRKGTDSLIKHPQQPQMIKSF